MELAGAEEYDVFLLAVAHLMNRQLETAAWLFWQDALRRPGDAMTLSRLGLVLHEMYVYTGATDPALLDGAIAALRGAAEAAPAEASVLNNLAYALSRRGRPEDLSEAAWLIKRAVELDPEEPLYWVRRALVAQAPDEPDKALESVFVAHAMSPVVTAALDPSRIDGFVEADKPYCEIVCLACDSCPPGIIGELNRITCLMEEQGARLACQAGELFPTSFDCFEGLPDYGILIPGLNAGLSILTPFGELHVSIDGDGVVHWKAGVKFPAGRLEPGAGAAGTWDPTDGVMVTQMGPYVKVTGLGRSDLVKSRIIDKFEAWGPNANPFVVKLASEYHDGAPRLVDTVSVETASITVWTAH